MTDDTCPVCGKGEECIVQRDMQLNRLPDVWAVSHLDCVKTLDTERMMAVLGRVEESKRRKQAEAELNRLRWDDSIPATYNAELERRAARLAKAEAERDELEKMLKALDAYVYRSTADGECEHGFWWEECPNSPCQVKDDRNLLADLRRRVKETP